MANYMEYLTGLTSVAEEPKPINLAANNLTIFPNPFVTTTNIRWNSYLPSKTDIKIYDQSGRTIKRFINQPRPKSSFVIGWDSKDDFGRTVKPGVYFVRLSNDVKTITKTIIKTE